MFKNLHPDHQITSKDAGTTFVCSCGATSKHPTEREANNAAGTHYAQTRSHQPGQFHGVCRQGIWVPLHTLTDDQRAEAGLQTKWNRTAIREVALVQCTLDTTDRAEYLDHMAALHRRKPRGPAQLKLGKGHWRAPKLQDEGKPLETKASTKTCRGCGLVVELGVGAETFIEEHRATCPERRAAA